MNESKEMTLPNVLVRICGDPRWHSPADFEPYVPLGVLAAPSS